METIDDLDRGLEDVSGLLELAVEADDEETFNEAVEELKGLEDKLGQLEFRRMFSGEYDSADCYTLISRPVPVVQKLRTGQACCCVYVSALGRKPRL